MVDASHSILSAHFIPDELTHQLVRTEGLHVTTASSVGPRALDVPSLARKLELHIVFEGTVCEDNTQLRVSVRVVNAEGFHILSERFETEADPQGVFKFSEKIVSELISRVGPERCRFEKRQSIATPSMFAVNPTSSPSEAADDRHSLRAGLVH